MSKIIRVLLSVGLLAQPFSGGVLAYDDNYQSPIQLTQFQPNLPQYNQFRHFYIPQIKPQWFLRDSYFLPDLDISPVTARLPQFNVPDFGDQVWTFNIDSLKFDEAKINRFTAEITTPFKTSIQYDFNKVRYQDKFKTPTSFQQTYQDSKGSLFQRERMDQVSVPNDAHTRYMNYVQRNYPEVASNPYAERPASLLPEPTQELVKSYKERWEIKTLPSGSEKANISIHSMKYEDNRYLNHYEGVVSGPHETLNFDVNMDRGSKGEIEAVRVEISAENAPTAILEWSQVDRVNPDDSFKTFRDSIPIPLLAGPRSTIRLNGVDQFETPLKLDAEGNINPKQLPDPSSLINLVNKSDIGINFSASPPEKINSSFSMGNAVRNLWYMVTGRWGEVKSMRNQLANLREASPDKFLLSAGFRDPSFMSYKDLKTAFGDKPITTYQMADGSILKGQMIISGGDLKSIEPGTERVISPKNPPVMMNGVEWTKGTFIWNGENYHLKGEGHFKTNEYLNYELTNGELGYSILGDGQGNLEVIRIGKLAPGLNLRDKTTGVELFINEDGKANFQPNQTVAIGLQGTEAEIEINEEGKLSKPFNVSLQIEDQERLIRVFGLRPNIETGGWSLAGAALIDQDYPIKISQPSTQGKGSNQLITTSLNKLTQAEMSQDGLDWVLSNGSVGLTINTIFDGDQSQFIESHQYHIGIGSKLTVTGKTEFAQYGLTVHRGQIELYDSFVNLGDGTLYEDKDGTKIFLAGLGGVRDVNLDGNQFTISLNEIPLSKDQKLKFSNLKLDGSLGDKKAHLKNTSYQVNASIEESDGSFLIGVFVKDNQISKIRDLTQLSKIPEPDQAYYVAPGAVSNSYHFALQQVGNPENNTWQKTTYLILGSATFPLAIAEDMVTFFFNAPYFASQGGQFMARALLQDNWGDRILDTLNAVANFSHAFIGSEPLASFGVNTTLKGISFVQNRIPQNISYRLNPLNYEVEAYGLGSNGGNIKVSFRTPYRNFYPSGPKITTVIGSSEDSLVAANWKYHNVLNVHRKLWSWDLNKKWLDAAISRGDDIYLATTPEFWIKKNPESILFDELNYLKSKRYVRRGNYMVRELK